jgi:transposase
MRSGQHDFAQLVAAVRAAIGTGGPGLTTVEVARRYRVGEDRVRAWIKGGKLKAINTAEVSAGKPRFVVLPEHLDEFERGRAVSAPTTKTVRRRRSGGQKDYFPD